MEKHLYCELDFLISFFKNQPAVSNLIEESEDCIQWRKYKNLFFSRKTLLLLDKDRNSLYELAKEDDFFKYLCKKEQAGEITIECNKHNYIKEIENVDPHTIFFLNNAEKCKELEDDYGMIFISEETKNKYAKFLFSNELISINKGEGFAWSFITKYKHPCNSITIVDNYILLSSNKQNLKNNLIELIKRILPLRLNKKKFEIRIVTKGEINDHRIDIECRRKFLNNELVDLGLPYKIDLTIIPDAADNHDRNLLTNYLWISSGFGFAISEGFKVRANTHFSFYPIISKEYVLDVVSALEKQYKQY